MIPGLEIVAAVWKGRVRRPHGEATFLVDRSNLEFAHQRNDSVGALRRQRLMSV
jgi:hypothetical protein